MGQRDLVGLPVLARTGWLAGGSAAGERADQVDGVTRAQTSVKAARTTVQADPDRCQPADVVAAIAQAGYTATPVS